MLLTFVGITPLEVLSIEGFQKIPVISASIQSELIMDSSNSMKLSFRTSKKVIDFGSVTNLEWFSPLDILGIRRHWFLNSDTKSETGFSAYKPSPYLWPNYRDLGKIHFSWNPEVLTGPRYSLELRNCEPQDGGLIIEEYRQKNKFSPAMKLALLCLTASTILITVRTYKIVSNGLEVSFSVETVGLVREQVSSTRKKRIKGIFFWQVKGALQVYFINYTSVTVILSSDYNFWQNSR